MNKTKFYQELQAQVVALIADEQDIIANMANVSALLFDTLEFVNWVGFYRVIDEQLVLGPFQGKVACIRIPLGKGVCGTAAKTGITHCIADVHQFSGHIACDAASNSEIVVPVKVDGKVVAVLDIDSMNFDRFDDQDQLGIETIIKHLEACMV
ncbi:MAG: L-methionine (R)-S-oxide reductase [Alteromonadaceae bacterium]|jgi:L-methionine (R)-S-oxide reductase|tara:strand:- start:4315 stop:4773 length:459 start_codon:yes stop_codon:yes gene_type:complete